ncbi:MAG: hypothetical protein HC903_07865 [Methylacidiphilales bacterium]|nr:hypothetical protein [Candidatus Methylacidiphilales bacterium]
MRTLHTPKQRSKLRNDNWALFTWNIPSDIVAADIHHLIVTVLGNKFLESK